MNTIPVIDLFAGPGGLGEGFSSNPHFRIKLSIEKDENAHKTLELRSFYRQFDADSVPDDYYEVLRAESLIDREQKKEELFKKYSNEAKAAKEEAWLCELGHEDFPEELVDKRITKALKGSSHWALIGGPPCQAYSLVGRSRRQEGLSGLNPEDHRVHLYKEYLRIIAVHHPAVFVMENVKGLLSAEVGDIKLFDLIKSDLAKPENVFPGFDSPEYLIYSLVKEADGFGENGQPVYSKNSDYLIKCEDYGIPQKRHRVILLGIRKDIQAIPQVLKPSKQITLEDVIGDLPKLRSGITRTYVKSANVIGSDGEQKTKRIYKKEMDSREHWQKLVERFRREIIRTNGFSEKTFLEMDSPSKFETGGEFIEYNGLSDSNPLKDWFFDHRIGGVVNHESRGHLAQDLKRYLFASIYSQHYGKFPRMKDYAEHGRELLPDHQNAESGKFADRFRVQLPDETATTVTSHISKDGHYFIHYDPSQCRSFTVREAARVQTFPDNYLFCGSRTAQFHQVGNAVPPFLASQISNIVANISRI